MAVRLLEFTSELCATPEQTWNWITSSSGILQEMSPWFRMSVPRGLTRLDEPPFVAGQPLFRSRLYLFRLIPWGHSDLTLLEWRAGNGFVEQSPMTGMKLWRHERWIEPHRGGCLLHDRLTFDPRFAGSLVAWFVQRMFTHRHAVLQKHLGRKN